MPTRSRPLLLLTPLILLMGCDSSTGPTVASCEPGEGVQLQVGEVSELAGPDARIVCVDGGSVGGEYVLVVFAANPSSTDGIPLALTGRGILPPGGGAAEAEQPGVAGQLTVARRPAGAEQPAVARQPAGAGRATARPLPSDRSFTSGPLPDLRLHEELRRLERRALSGKVGRIPGEPTARFQPPSLGSVPAPGDLVTLNTRTTDPCEDPRYRGGIVKAVSETAIVVADTLNPGGGFSDDRYEHFAATFDTLVGPLGTQNFGTITDLDGNGRTILFFTQDVNRLSGSGSDTFIGGFFFARDLFPREATARLAACEHSNEAELLYLMVPDPQGTINNNVRSLAFVERVTLTTMAHELQHLINSAQRLHIIESDTPFEDVWLNEGLSHIAEEVLFYETTGFGPGQSLGASDFPQGSDEREMLNRHQITNTFRFEEYLQDPTRNSPYNTEDLLPTRGATWHFLRYAADRRGGDQAALFRELVSSQSGGVQNLADALASEAVPLSRWFTDWAVALYADDHVPGIESRFRDPSWNHRSLFEAINDGAAQPFPLAVRSIEDGSVLSASPMGGGAAFFRFGLGVGATGLIEITSLGGSPPAGLRVTLMRVE